LVVASFTWRIGENHFLHLFEVALVLRMVSFPDVALRIIMRWRKFRFGFASVGKRVVVVADLADGVSFGFPK
jgi:hypothetical protein